MGLIYSSNNHARNSQNATKSPEPIQAHLLIQRFLKLKQILKFKSIYLPVNDGCACFRAPRW